MVPVDQGAAAAGKDDAGIRITPRQFGGRGDALGGFVERDAAARGRYVGRDRAAEHDDAVGRPARGVPGRKALLQRQYQHIAERRKSGERDQDEARHYQKAREPRQARAQETSPTARSP